METTTNLSLADQIYLGQHDEQLADIERAIKSRKAQSTESKARSLRYGDVVHFSSAIRPRYLVGLEAKVVRVNNKSITVNCPQNPAYQRFSGAQGVRCANAFIEELV